MFYRVNTGAANNAQTFPAFHRRDSGANAATGIRAAHSAFIKRHDPANADPEHAQTATDNAAAGIAAANRLANATKTAASAFLQGAKETMRSGSYTALDILESTEDGRAILAKLKASDDGLEILHSPDTGRVYVYTGRVEDELEIIRKREWERTYGETAQTAAPAAQHADSVEISDAGRELAAKMIENSAAPAPIINVVNDSGYEKVASQLRVYSSTDDEAPPELKNFIEHMQATAQERAQAKANPIVNPNQASFTGMDFVYADSTLLYALYTNSDMDGNAAFALSVAVGRLLKAPAGTLEEGVANREKGVELTKYIVENYIDDPDTRQRVLDNVKELADIFEQRDKGYFVAMTTDGYSITRVDDGLLIRDGKPTVKAATDTINRAKNSLDMNAVKEDAINIFKKIVADYLNADGTLARRW